MTLPISPTAFPPPLNQTVADRLEAVVRIDAMFLDKIDANATRIFVKFDNVEFD
jgi:hypothetical protein